MAPRRPCGGASGGKSPAAVLPLSTPLFSSRPPSPRSRSKLCRVDGPFGGGLPPCRWRSYPTLRWRIGGPPPLVVLGANQICSLQFITFSFPGTQETIISEKEQEQCPKNYLTRAFDQLIVVLGRFQTKIKSETSKKSSEILAATGEIIRQQLEGVEVQMQADVDKLVNAGKSKRKHLESTFEEQQEKLKTLHEKFKEEVDKQLLGCRNSLEDFESEPYHAELKGVAEKQK